VYIQQAANAGKEMKTERHLDRIIEIPEAFHEAGTLSPAVLRKLYSFTRHSAIERSIETGCGKSTLSRTTGKHRNTTFGVDGYRATRLRTCCTTYRDPFAGG